MKFRTIFATILYTLSFFTFIVGTILLVFGFPFDIFRAIRMFDAGVLGITIFSALLLYGKTRQMSGYQKGYKEALSQK